MKTCKLKCDNHKCNWNTEDNPFDWHNKQCPKCKDCIIITDEDYKVLKGMEALEDLGIVQTGENIKKETKGLEVRINTANLRK